MLKSLTVQMSDHLIHYLRPKYIKFVACSSIYLFIFMSKDGFSSLLIAMTFDFQIFIIKYLLSNKYIFHLWTSVSSFTVMFFQNCTSYETLTHIYWPSEMTQEIKFDGSKNELQEKKSKLSQKQQYKYWI